MTGSFGYRGNFVVRKFISLANRIFGDFVALGYLGIFIGHTSMVSAKFVVAVLITNAGKFSSVALLNQPFLVVLLQSFAATSLLDAG